MHNSVYRCLLLAAIILVENPPFLTGRGSINAAWFSFYYPFGNLQSMLQITFYDS